MRRERRRRLLVLCGVLLAVILILRLQNSFSLRMWTRHRGLQAENGQFMLEGEPLRILGGSMHYFRVPKEYWKDRMLKMKACGLNVLTTYVPWNLHEPQRGKFDFTGNLDIWTFLTIAADVGLWVILRPGPYICSEWDLGGLPSWLLRDKDMQLRTTYKGFAEATEAYFDHLIPTVAGHQYTRGGVIIAVQVENEYGSYAKDANYMEFIKTALVRRGIVELLMTSDNKDGISSGSMEGVLATINFQKTEPILFSYLESIQGNKPVLVMEYWTGWFDHWGGDHNVFDVDQMVSTVSDVLTKGASINLYMFHGGTNFGFMAGALHFHEYRSDVTSYDYDAPLTEAGDYTSKYFKLRELFSKHHVEPLLPAPSLLPKGAYTVKLKRSLSLWDVLLLTGEPFKSEVPVNMENLPVNDGNGQSYGYTLYETVIYGGGKFQTKGHVRDRAQVFVSTQSVGFIDYKNQELDIAEVPGYRKLRILVENCGRVNYGTRINDQRKGLVGDVFLRDVPLRNFRIYSLDMNSTFVSGLNSVRWSDVSEEDRTGPVFFQGALEIGYSPLDTYLCMKGWKKGVVFVNGKNLGRYWNIGPQETLYLPGTWLWPGVNEITIFEEEVAGSSLYSVDIPLLGRTQYVD